MLVLVWKIHIWNIYKKKKWLLSYFQILEKNKNKTSPTEDSKM